MHVPDEAVSTAAYVRHAQTDTNQVLVVCARREAVIQNVLLDVLGRARIGHHQRLTVGADHVVLALAVEAVYLVDTGAASASVVATVSQALVNVDVTELTLVAGIAYAFSDLLAVHFVHLALAVQAEFAGAHLFDLLAQTASTARFA